MKIATILFILSICLAISCKSNKEASTSKSEETLSKIEKPKAIIFTDRIIVSIQPDYTIAEIEKKYMQYELKKFGKTSKRQNTYLFDFNDELISDIKLVKLLNKDDEHIIKAERIQESMHAIQTAKSSKKKTVKLPVK